MGVGLTIEDADDLEISRRKFRARDPTTPRDAEERDFGKGTIGVGLTSSRLWAALQDPHHWYPHLDPGQASMAQQSSTKEDTRETLTYL
jgi:hypothetical protein